MPIYHHKKTPASNALTDLIRAVLLIMLPGYQDDWVHAVPKTARPVGDRINWTFRPHVDAIFQGRGSANGNSEQKPV